MVIKNRSKAIFTSYKIIIRDCTLILTIVHTCYNTNFYMGIVLYGFRIPLGSSNDLNSLINSTASADLEC